MKQFLHFNINETGRDFIVGDIHGSFEYLDQLLLQANFDDSVDRLFCVGDLVDRGNYSDRAIDFKGYVTRGNHEEMTIEYYNGKFPVELYLMNGGGWFIPLDREIQKKYVDMFSELPYAIEIDTPMGLIGIVHAETPLAWDDLRSYLEDYDISGPHDRKLRESLTTGRERIRKRFHDPVDAVYHVFVGHTPVRAPFTLGNVTYIDTGVSKGDSLTMVELGDKFIYHSVQVTQTDDSGSYQSEFI